MNKIAAITALVAVGVLGSGTRAIAQQDNSPQKMVDPNRVVLVVNGDEIKGAEYYRRMEYLPGVGRQMGKTFSEFPPGFLTIQQLIDERLIFELARQKGVYPSDQEVEDELKIRQADNPNVLQEWLASGGTSDDLKYQLRLQIAQFKIETFGVTITDTEVQKEYDDRPDAYTVPKQYTLRVIYVANADDTKAVDQELTNGKAFADVAKEKSIDLTRVVGGLYGTIPFDKLDTETQNALADVKIGQSSKWLTTSPSGGNGVYLKFYLENVIPAKKMPLDDRLRRVIRRRMMIDRGHVKNPNTAKELDGLRAKAKVDIKQHEFADAYQKFLKAYLQQHGGAN
ncbi:MAG: peptidyl-prolyl cis-trans isomerase [Fimbriimonas sp.]|nr:peptidyl-prolyl cis-trans isomerase [Fimbriimonas sp.]